MECNKFQAIGLPLIFPACRNFKVVRTTGLYRISPSNKVWVREGLQLLCLDVYKFKYLR